ncbi:unnamed protein product [Closterium sp. NIES-54]
MPPALLPTWPPPASTPTSTPPSVFTSQGEAGREGCSVTHTVRSPALTTAQGIAPYSWASCRLLASSSWTSRVSTTPVSPTAPTIANQHSSQPTTPSRLPQVDASHRSTFRVDHPQLAPSEVSAHAVAPVQIDHSCRPARPETSPTLRWTGKVGDASAFRVWGSRAFVRDLSADKLSPRAYPCVFLGFPPDAPGWQFYHPTSRRVLSSQDVTFDESVPYYRLFLAPLPLPPLFLAPGPPPVDPLPPQGPSSSGVSQVDAVEPVEVAVDSGAARGAEPAGAGSGGAEPEGAESGGAESSGAEHGGAESGGAESRGAESGGAEPGGAEPGGAEPGGAEPGGAGSARVASRGTSSRRELLSPQELREWFARRWSRAAGAGGTCEDLESRFSNFLQRPAVAHRVGRTTVHQGLEATPVADHLAY